MNTNGDRALRRASSWCLKAGAVLLGLAVSASDLQAQDFIKVEEDWEMVVGTPDAYVNAPQVTTVISPLTEDDAYCAFNLNYKTEAGYAEGGLQIHVWNPTSPLLVKDSSKRGMMQTAGEVITWTSEMGLASGVLSFKVKNGNSTTWGTFGRLGYLEAEVGATTLMNLNGYSSDTSVAASGVSFGGNRVTSLKLKRVRYYTASGLHHENVLDRTVHPRQ